MEAPITLECMMAQHSLLAAQIFMEQKWQEEAIPALGSSISLLTEQRHTTPRYISNIERGN